MDSWWRRWIRSRGPVTTKTFVSMCRGSARLSTKVFVLHRSRRGTPVLPPGTCPFVSFLPLERPRHDRSCTDESCPLPPADGARDGTVRSAPGVAGGGDRGPGASQGCPRSGGGGGRAGLSGGHVSRRRRRRDRGTGGRRFRGRDESATPDPSRYGRCGTSQGGLGGRTSPGHQPSRGSRSTPGSTHLGERPGIGRAVRRGCRRL